MAGEPYVILVEDDRDTADMYRLGLEKGGFRTTVLQDPASLEAELERETPDLLILDWLLPETTGGEILERLRAQPATARLPVFMLSNALDEEARAAAGLAGALEWLVKAKTTPLELVAALRLALSG